MNTRNLLFSAVHFLLVVSLFAAGGFFLAIGCTPRLRVEIVTALTDNSELFLLIGAFTLCAAALLLYGFYHLNKVRFFQLKLGPVQDAAAEPELIAQLARIYFSTLFPTSTIPLEVQVHNGKKIEVIAEIPEPSEELLAKIEEELGGIFAKHLRYKKEFLLTVAIP